MTADSSLGGYKSDLDDPPTAAAYREDSFEPLPANFRELVDRGTKILDAEQFAERAVVLRPAVSELEAVDAMGESFGFADNFGRFISHSLQRDDPQEFRLLGCFTTAAAVGPHLVSMMRWGERRANLWALMVADSGAGKSTTLEFPHRAIGEVQPDRMLPSSSSPESLLDLLRDLSPEQEVRRKEEGVPCYRGVGAIIKDEASQLFRQVTTPGYMANAAEGLIELYDGGRPVVISTRSGGVVRVSNPCLSMFGATTPSMFGATVKPELVSGGFLARFIFLELPRQSRKLTTVADTASARDWYQLMSDLAAMRALVDRGRIVAAWPDEVLLRFDAYREFLDSELRREGRPEEMEAFYHRAPEQALKLSMILAFSSAARDGARQLTVTQPALIAAIQMVEHSRATIRRLLELLTASPMVREAYRARRWLLNQPERRAGNRELYRAMHWSADDARKARQTAESHELIDPEHDGAWILLENA